MRKIGVIIAILVTLLSISQAVGQYILNKGIFETKHPIDKLRYYTAAARLDPFEVVSRYSRANMLLVMDRSYDAIQAYTELQRRSPDYLNVHFFKGLAYERYGQVVFAVDEFQKELIIRPFNDGARQEKNKLWNLVNYLKASLKAR